MDSAATDPKGLIRESYRIEGITGYECRSIFVDWALSLPEGMTAGRAIPALLEQYAADHPGHPMNEVLRGGLDASDDDKPARRGGRAARVPPGT
ncbi:hypothetical protein [Oceaniglobus indicus]|uniref:hypothetical protein n=1 Tax=Oceaniglobus indicus TaxID=2047749 RepID=UPI000C17573D|nr:hypothetical protein [Oceaniglobus indicus]